MEQDVLTVVPPELQKLVRLVARAFYQPEHFLVLDILAKHPCVTEDDLYQLLRFEVKKLRVILAFLKKDKLIKNIQRIESLELSSGDKKNVTVQYYYINYKVFVNVVKFKLDRMREKIQSEERKARNRTSYVCPHCQNTFTDLDVDRLMDPVEQVLKCTMCRTVLEEDVPEGNIVDARSLLSRLNDQLQPILLLLKETENMNLAPEVLEPEPRGINKRILEASRRHGGQGPKSTEQWTTSKVDDIYGDQTVSVNFGTEEKMKKGKAAPQWMTESTVYSEDSRVGGDKSVAMDTTNKSNVPDDEIMALLVSEGKKKKTSELVAPPTGSREPEDSSSSEGESTSEDEDGMGTRLRHLEPLSLDDIGNDSSNLSFGGNGEDDDEDNDFESDEDDLTMTVGDKVFQIGDITQDLVAKMTPREKEKYTKLCQQAYSKIY